MDKKQEYLEPGLTIDYMKWEDAYSVGDIQKCIAREYAEISIVLDEKTTPQAEVDNDNEREPDSQ